MKTIPAILVLAASVLPAPGAASDQKLSPAQKSIQLAERSARLSPENVEVHNRLAKAWLRRGDEVQLLDCYREAEKSARQASSLNPDNLTAKRLLIESLLGQRRHQEALELAEDLNRRNPDNVEVYGYVVDAAVALGRLEQAEAAAQWMLDLRPNHPEAYARAAELRELFGDLAGAAEFLNRAYSGVQPDQPERQAVLLADLARLLRLLDQPTEAERVLNMAARLLPEGPSVLLELARLRQTQDRGAEAIDLLKKRAEVSPGPERWYRLAEALRREGDEAGAAEAFQRFEELALPLRQLPHNENILLTLYWAGRPARVKEALELAESELRGRRDVWSRDALAWALHANQRHGEASKVIDEVLSVGVKDPGVLARAAAIRAAQEN